MVKNGQNIDSENALRLPTYAGSLIEQFVCSGLVSPSFSNHGAYRRIKQSAADTALAQCFDVLSRPLLRDIELAYAVDADGGAPEL